MPTQTKPTHISLVAPIPLPDPAELELDLFIQEIRQWIQHIVQHSTSVVSDLRALVKSLRNTTLTFSTSSEDSVIIPLTIVGLYTPPQGVTGPLRIGPFSREPVDWPSLFQLVFQDTTGTLYHLPMGLGTLAGSVRFFMAHGDTAESLPFPTGLIRCISTHDLVLEVPLLPETISSSYLFEHVETLLPLSLTTSALNNPLLRQLLPPAELSLLANVPLSIKAWASPTRMYWELFLPSLGTSQIPHNLKGNYALESADAVGPSDFTVLPRIAQSLLQSYARMRLLQKTCEQRGYLLTACHLKFVDTANFTFRWDWHEASVDSIHITTKRTADSPPPTTRVLVPACPSGSTSPPHNQQMSPVHQISSLLQQVRQFLETFQRSELLC